MNKKIVILILVVTLIAGTIIFLEKQKPDSQTGVTQNVSSYKYELQGISGYINTDNITIQSLIGKKIILVDFWTYSCINCQRTTPHLNAWYEKYQKEGLEIIGVHTPEFAFEKEYANVKSAVEKFNIKYPVVLDNNYATWKAYQNNYWPRKYIIDLNGEIVYDHIGEGSYEETEKKIQDLLNTDTKMSQPEEIIDVDFTKVQSPETYFGASRNVNFGNGVTGAIGTYKFILPSKINSNLLYLGGSWNIQPEYAESKEEKTKVTFSYNAKNVYLVASANQPTEIVIQKDNKNLENSAGEDVKNEYSQSKAIIKEERLYKLIEGDSYGPHVIEITINQSGFRAFAFTFG